MTLAEAIEHHETDGDLQVAQWLKQLEQILKGAYDQSKEVAALKDRAARLQTRLNGELVTNHRLCKRVEDLEGQLDELRVTNKRLEFDLFSEMARNGRMTRRIDGLLRKIGEKAEGQASD